MTSEVIDCDSTADLVLLASKEGLLSTRFLAIGTSAGCDDKEDAMDRRGVLKAAAFVVVSAGLSPMSSRVSAAERVSERRSPMSNANEAVVRLLKTWSERDAKRRRELVAQTFTEVSGGTAEAPLYYKGTDFAVIADDGRLKSVIGFTDATAAPVTQP